MQQVELFPVPSPCIDVCQSNAKGYCLGCLRSRAERQKWHHMMPAEKLRVIDLCALRKAKLEAIILAKKESKKESKKEKEQIKSHSPSNNEV